MLDPENTFQDGITHINIYAAGKTELGRLLSHFAPTPFIHPYFGPFASMEGFWYYIKAEKKDERLRQLSGAHAKFYGKKIPSVRINYFNLLIVDANRLKIEQNPAIADLVVQSTLPFSHYYLYEDKDEKGEDHVYQKHIDGFDWLIEGFEKIRTSLKEGTPLPKVDYWAILK